MSDWRPLLTELQTAAAQAQPEDIPDLLAELERAKAMATVRLLVTRGNVNGDLMTAKQVAEFLKVDGRWPYRHAAELGAVRLSEKCLRFPRKKVERFLVECRNQILDR